MYKYEKHDRSVTRSIQFCGKVGNSSFPFHHRGVEHNTTDKPASQPAARCWAESNRVPWSSSQPLYLLTILAYNHLWGGGDRRKFVGGAACLMLWIVLGTRVVDWSPYTAQDRQSVGKWDCSLLVHNHCTECTESITALGSTVSKAGDCNGCGDVVAESKRTEERPIGRSYTISSWELYIVWMLDLAACRRLCSFLKVRIRRLRVQLWDCIPTNQSTSNSNQCI